MKLKNFITSIVVVFLVVTPGYTQSNISIPVSEHSCSSFVFESDTGFFFATNFDNKIYDGLVFVNKRGLKKAGWEQGTTGKVAEWYTRYGSVTLSLVGYQYVWCGMNEAGLALSTMTLSSSVLPPADEMPPLETTVYAQYLLDTCASIAEVEETFSKVRPSGADVHFLVSDKSGKCMTIEFIDGKIVATTGEQLPVKALTNSPYRILLRDWQKQKKRNAMERVFYRDHRFDVIARRLETHKKTNRENSIKFAFATLAAVQGEKFGIVPTQWSVVMDSSAMKIHFFTRTHTDIRSIAFQDLDFSCSTPPLMMDIHKKIKGDILPSMQPYSLEINLKHMMRFLDKWGIEETEENIRDLLEFFDSWECGK